jgi:hypothetical protein
MTHGTLASSTRAPPLLPHALASMQTWGTWHTLLRTDTLRWHALAVR